MPVGGVEAETAVVSEEGTGELTRKLAEENISISAVASNEDMEELMWAPVVYVDNEVLLATESNLPVVDLGASSKKLVDFWVEIR